MTSTNYEALIEEILSKGKEALEPVSMGLTPPVSDSASAIEAKTAMPMFYLSALSLIMFGFATADLLVQQSFNEAGINEFSVIFVFIQGLVLLEFVLLAASGVLKGMSRTEKIFYILHSSFAPFRLGRRFSQDNSLMYFPFWGFCKTNEAFFDKLRRAFSTPMLLIALVIVPILLIDLKFKEKAEALMPDIVYLMRMTEVFIWIIFTYEFITMFSVTSEKLDYCKKNWIDLIIIILPFVAAFMTSFSFLRLLRLNQVARAYRLKGVFSKVRQALILADSVQKIMFPKPEKQLLHLKKKLRENKRQQEELERQVLVAVNRYKKHIEKQQKKQEKQQNNKSANDAESKG